MNADALCEIFGLVPRDAVPPVGRIVRNLSEADDTPTQPDTALIDEKLSANLKDARSKLSKAEAALEKLRARKSACGTRAMSQKLQIEIERKRGQIKWQKKRERLLLAKLQEVERQKKGGNA